MSQQRVVVFTNIEITKNGDTYIDYPPFLTREEIDGIVKEKLSQRGWTEREGSMVLKINISSEEESSVELEYNVKKRKLSLKDKELNISTEIFISKSASEEEKNDLSEKVRNRIQRELPELVKKKVNEIVDKFKEEVVPDVVEEALVRKVKLMGSNMKIIERDDNENTRTLLIELEVGK